MAQRCPYNLTRMKANARRKGAGCSRPYEDRRGVACVEFAILSPLLVLTTFAIVDVCNYMHLRQKLNTVAFETARIASLEASTFESARLDGLRFARARGVNGANVIVEAFDPASFPTRASLTVGFTLRARVDVPVEQNIPGPFILFRGSRATSQLVRMSAR